jgi:hypothetical protein
MISLALFTATAGLFALTYGFHEAALSGWSDHTYNHIGLINGIGVTSRLSFVANRKAC